MKIPRRILTSRARWVVGALAALALVGWITLALSEPAPLANADDQSAMQCSAGECGMLSFGDSVAAGYGLGNSEGNNDNPSAYPAIMAGQLNTAYENLAVEGACAAGKTEESYCTKVSVSDQIANAISGNFYPTRITLTVGANDINFAGCLQAIISTPHLILNTPMDPCSQANLTAHLAKFSQALKTDLQTLANAYHNVGIQVMDYYNPFPPAPYDACSAIDLLTLKYDAAYDTATFHLPEQLANAAAFAKYRYDHAAFEKDAHEVETRLYADADTIVNRLNGAINTAKAGVSGVTTVTTADDFAFYNICAPTQAAFAPYANWSETETTFFNGTKTLASGHLGADNGPVCTDPVADPAPTFIDELIPNPYGPAVHFSFSAYVNCFPHPTTQGQAEIASDFIQQAP